MTCEKAGVLVVGTGEAGVRVATTLRELGYDRPIVLCGAEPHPPYQRPPLSKAFLQGKADHADLALRTPEFFHDAGIDVRPGLPVTDVEVDGAGSGTATCGSGVIVEFHRLVLATGARPRPLPVAGAGLDGVCVLRGLDDAEQLRDRLATAHRVVIVGGGYIGLEAAAFAAARGQATTVVEREDRLLSRVTAPPLSEFLADRHRQWGVEFELAADVHEVLGDGRRATGVRLADGRVLPADLVLVGIGAIPETTLAAKLGLDVRRGVVVDATSRTSHPGVWAIGDCTVQQHPHLPGELIGVESVQNANDQARAAAAAVAGAAPPPPPVPWFWSDQHDLKVQIAGLSNGFDEYVVRDADPVRGLTVLYYRGGALIAAESVNRPSDFLAVKRALSRGQTIAPDRAPDLTAPLKHLVTDRE